MTAWKQIVSVGIGVGMVGVSQAQIPDLLNALDAGGRAMGVGGATASTDGNTFSALNNPAGLAYIPKTSIGTAFRNLPESENRISGDFNDPTFSTSRKHGPRKLTHAGFAMPFRGGVLGLSYTLGGYIADRTRGDNLTNGNLVNRGYDSNLTVQYDFFTLAYGKRAGRNNYGVGIVFANQYLRDDTTYVVFDNNQNQIDVVLTDNSGNSRGIGLVAGFQTNPDDRSVFGASIRTPIGLTRNAATGAYNNRIPGKASIGYATRSDFLRNGRDFFAYGAEVDYYFAGDRGGLLDRKDVLAGGVGFEYNTHRWGGRVPFRVGYQFSPEGGRGFSERNALTFGLGYRPDNSDLALDLNFAAPSGGGTLDTALSVGYRIGK
ncbi:MAG: hypothetical protein KF733_11465 [Fimbriimonadaceae bacterium]|nr:MAG: hypothetical protein KF733_11465 [Fimbriimonadaceae bacterium]